VRSALRGRPSMWMSLTWANTIMNAGSFREWAGGAHVVPTNLRMNRTINKTGPGPATLSFTVLAGPLTALAGRAAEDHDDQIALSSMPGSLVVHVREEGGDLVLHVLGRPGDVTGAVREEVAKLEARVVAAFGTGYDREELR
jgi:hypothetical protein